MHPTPVAPIINSKRNIQQTLSTRMQSASECNNSRLAKMVANLQENIPREQQKQ